MKVLKFHLNMMDDWQIEVDIIETITSNSTQYPGVKKILWLYRRINEGFKLGFHHLHIAVAYSIFTRVNDHLNAHKT